MIQYYWQPWAQLWPFLIVVFFFGIILAAFWIWALIDCITSKLDSGEKLLWVIIMILLNFIGAIMYVVLAKERHVHIKPKKGHLYRPRSDRMIAGVCGGLGKYIGMDPTVIRLVWAILLIPSLGTGLLVYIIAWLIIPQGK